MSIDYSHARLAGIIAALSIAAIACAAPPQVIKATPENGDTDVDPNLREIRIEFDQDMSMSGFSFCGGGPTFPKTRGGAYWDGPRTCILPVKLEPNHQYNFSVNCPSAQNFRNKKGQPAQIDPISFKTGDARPDKNAGSRAAKENAASVRVLRRAIHREYSYRDLREVDWNQLFDRYEPKLSSADSTARFIELCSEMLAKAEDIHIWLEAGGLTYGTHKRSIRPNCSLKVLPKVVPNWNKRSSRVVSGRFDDGIGYILIASWEQKHAQAIDAAFEALDDLRDCKGIIIDVRLNSGGAEPLAQKFAGCFVEKPVVYAKHVYRDHEADGGFTEPSERTLEPTKARPEYRGKVAVLSGRYVMSSCEAFLLMMKQVPNCKLVGGNSYGSSGNPKPHHLPNGVTVYLPSWKAMTADGNVFEGKGIEPDIKVETNAEDFEKTDPVLEAALRYLRG